jgi:hypothetical protein
LNHAFDMSTCFHEYSSCAPCSKWQHKRCNEVTPRHSRWMLGGQVFHLDIFVAIKYGKYKPYHIGNFICHKVHSWVETITWVEPLFRLNYLKSCLIPNFMNVQQNYTTMFLTYQCNIWIFLKIFQWISKITFKPMFHIVIILFNNYLIII